MTVETSKNTVLASPLFCDKLTINIDYKKLGEQHVLLEGINEFLGLNLHAKSYPTPQYQRRIFIYEGEYCRRRFNIDHLCRLNIDQGLKLAA